MKKHLIFLIAGFTGWIFPSCDETFISTIPDYPVYLELNLTASYPTFSSPNQSLTFETPIKATDRLGYGGIVVYIDFEGEYRAFDMACPNEAKTDIRVYPNDLGQLVCEECSSVYDISYGIGNPIEGPAYEQTYEAEKGEEKKIFLKAYNASKQGDYLYITR